MHPRASTLIETLNLQPHPEGGYFCEIFRSTHRVQPIDDRNERSALTTIYFLLVAGGFSHWHRVKSDEIWHYYEGDDLELFWIECDGGRLHRCLLGQVGEGREPIVVVPAGCWQAAQTKGAYTLVGCTVGPGFEYEDFEMLNKNPEEAEEIRQRFPELRGFV